MPTKMAEFEKVSMIQYAKDMRDSGIMGKLGLSNDDTNFIIRCYKDLIIPIRATSGSAGYDFFLPFDLDIKPGEIVKFPTGIRCRMDTGWVLMAFPRSSLGFKYKMQLMNTVGIIDSDYYNAQNQGHIMAKFCNDSRDGGTIHIAKGQAYMQGIFVPYGITVTDVADGERTGGFGSTDSK